MQDDFFDSFDDEEEGDEVPDWMTPIAEDEDGFEEEDGDFDMLRQKSARAGSAYDEIPEEDEFADDSAGFSLDSFTPGQRLILVILLLLIVIVGFAGLFFMLG